MRKHQKRVNLILLILISISIILWILSKENFLQIFDRPFQSLSQISAILGILFLSIEYILTARYLFIEKIFNGLDKVYRYHHQIGKYSILFLFTHILFVNFNKVIENGFSLKLFLSLPETSIIFGGIAFILLLSLLILTLLIKLPYHVWKITHNFIGIPLFPLFFHILLIESDISNSIILKVWILIFISLGVISYIYKALIYRQLFLRYRYIIEKVVPLPGAIFDYYCKPVDKKLNFKAGQFVFTEFLSKAVSKEHHPFTITSAPHDDYLRLSIKIEGDYTKNIGKVVQGEEIIMFGPYGTMDEEFSKTDKPQIWIGGGIGVAPFLSQIKTLPKQPKIFLYYLTPNKVISAYDKELLEVASKLDNLKYFNNCSNVDGRLTVERIKKDVGDITKYKIFMCGPTQLMEQFTKELIESGVDVDNIIFEEFIFKD